MKKKKVILVTNIISPYSISVYNSLLNNKNLDLKIIFFAEKERNRKWNVDKDGILFDYSVLRSFHFHFQKIELPIYFHWGLWSHLTRFNPDVIFICGYTYWATIESLLYARLNNKKIILRSGSHLLSGFMKNGIVEAYKRWIIPKFDGYLSYGSKSTEHLINYGATPDKIVTGINTVDVDYFIRETNSIGSSECYKLKEKYSAKNILYVGNFVAHKGVFNLIKAFKKVKKNNNNAGLILVGDGIEKKKYKEFIKKNNIKDVYFPGFIHKKEIVKFYRIADLFILPSFNEVWGLVINEALASGLFVLSSKYAGASYDLIKEGCNGRVINPENIDEMNKVISKSLEKEYDRKKIQDTIKDKNPNYQAALMYKSIKEVMKNG